MVIAIFPFELTFLRIFCFKRTSFGKTNWPKSPLLLKVFITSKSVALSYENAWFLLASSFSQKETNWPTLVGVIFATLNLTDLKFN